MQSKVRSDHRFSSIMAARRAYADGENITAAIREAEGRSENPKHAIEIAYDLQSGSYSQGAESDPDRWQRYGQSIAAELAPHLRSGETLLDCGTGEMTSLVSTLDALEARGLAPQPAAFDVSWSRLRRGRRFVAEHGAREITSFVGDTAAIALADCSVDVVMTVHSLEPNGGRERELLASLLRVARRRVVLFEPCFERASREAQARMASHGYVRGLEQTVTELGGKVRSVMEFSMPANPLNPTFVFVIDPGEASVDDRKGFQFRCPVTGTQLVEAGGVFHSPEAGIVYPIIEGIAVLRPEHAILASHFGTTA